MYHSLHYSRYAQERISIRFVLVLVPNVKFPSTVPRIIQLAQYVLYCGIVVILVDQVAICEKKVDEYKNQHIMCQFGPG